MFDFEAFKAKYQNVPVEEYPNRVCETMPEPVVSVHVSTYQHVDFIRDCLEGVLMQETDFPFEIIIGEDESDDGTRKICKEYANQHPEQIRLFLHRRENNIAIHGRPTGRFQFTYSHFTARGKYIAICEGDDYWTDPQKLQKQVDFLEANPEYAMTYQPFVNKAAEEHNQDIPEVRRGIKTHVQTLTVVYRNVVDKYPEEYFLTMNGDVFLFALVKQHGKAAPVLELRPAVRTLHLGSMWTSEKKRDQTFINLKSLAGIFANSKDVQTREKMARRVTSMFCKVIYTVDFDQGIQKELYRIIESYQQLKKVGLEKRAAVRLILRTMILLFERAFGFLKSLYLPPIRGSQ